MTAIFSIDARYAFVTSDQLCDAALTNTFQLARYKYSEIVSPLRGRSLLPRRSTFDTNCTSTLTYVQFGLNFDGPFSHTSKRLLPASVTRSHSRLVIHHCTSALHDHTVTESSAGHTEGNSTNTTEPRCRLRDR